MIEITEKMKNKAAFRIYLELTKDNPMSIAYDELTVEEKQVFEGCAEASFKVFNV